MTTAEMKVAMQSWRARNPLYRWRDAHSMNTTDLAMLLGCSAESIYDWERGLAKPRVMKKLADVLGISEVALVRAWDVWMRERPKL